MGDQLFHCSLLFMDSFYYTNPAQPATPLLWYSLNNDHLYCSVLFLPNKCKSTKVKASSEAIETGSYALTLPGVRNDRTETFTILSRAL